MLDAIEALPERQRRALGTALALEDADEPDRLATSAGVLTLLDEVAGEQPLLVLVDDAHWIDRESAEVIAFVARRTAGIELGLLAAVRTGERSVFDFGELPTRGLEPLSDDQSLELLTQRHGSAIESGAARRLAELSAGNPLALIELPASMTAEQLEGQAPLPDPVPVAARIEQAFLRRADHLAAETRVSLVVAAAGSELPATTIKEAATALEGGSLEPAEAESLVRVEQDRVHFAHPLLRSAVYQSADAALRRRAHEALAEALADEPDLQAWQLAASLPRPRRADRRSARGVGRAGDQPRGAMPPAPGHSSVRPSSRPIPASMRDACALPPRPRSGAETARMPSRSASARFLSFKTRSCGQTSSNSSPRSRGGRPTRRSCPTFATRRRAWRVSTPIAR